jgi:hypothetical protein
MRVAGADFLENFCSSPSSLIGAKDGRPGRLYRRPPGTLPCHPQCCASFLLLIAMRLADSRAFADLGRARGPPARGGATLGEGDASTWKAESVQLARFGVSLRHGKPRDDLPPLHSITSSGRARRGRAAMRGYSDRVDTR